MPNEKKTRRSHTQATADDAVNNAFSKSKIGCVNHVKYLCNNLDTQ